MIKGPILAGPKGVKAQPRSSHEFLDAHEGPCSLVLWGPGAPQLRERLSATAPQGKLWGRDELSVHPMFLQVGHRKERADLTLGISGRGARDVDYRVWPSTGPGSSLYVGDP